MRRMLPLVASSFFVLSCAGDSTDRVVPPGDMHGRYDRLSNLQEMVRIGSLEGASDALGAVSGVVLDGDVIHVLDRLSHRLRTYSSDGTLLAEMGRFGEGPGEFRSPARILKLGDELLILDQNRRMTSIRWDGSHHEILRTATLPLTPQGLCAVQGSIVVHGVLAGSSAAVHLLDETSRIQRSLAPYAAVDHGMLDQSLLQGRIACSEDDDLIYLALDAESAVSAFVGATGELIWQTRIPNFVPIEVVLVDGTSVRHSVPDNGDRVHVFSSLVALEDRALFAQVEEQLVSGEQGRRMSYVINDSGDLATVEPTMDPVVAASRTHLVTVVDNPFPTVVVWDLGRVAR